MYDTDNQVAVEAADVIDEACEDEVSWKRVLFVVGEGRGKRKGEFFFSKNLDTDCSFLQANLQYLIELSPVLLHLGEVGHRLLTRYVTISS